MGFSVSVFADEKLMGGDRVGNGGDVVVCGKRVELLDIYEARISGYEIKKPVGKTYQEMIKSLLQTNLLPIQPKRAAKYLKFLETFENEAQFLPGINLSDVGDAGMVAIPIGCIPDQIAIQLSDDERPAGKKRYTVNLDLWNKLDEFNKMALVLHEIIYREAIEHKSSNSMVVRATVGEILKTKLDLGIFLSLVADLSNKIEYKKYTWNVCELCRPVISFYTNEYNEFVMKLEDKDLKLQVENREVNTPVVDIRVSDGKILDSAGIVYLRAGKETLIYNEGNKKILITTDQDMDYQFGSFLNPKNASIRIEFKGEYNYVLDFKQVNRLDWPNGFNGQFYLKYNDIILNDPEASYIRISESGEIQAASQRNNNMLIKLGNNLFKCSSYEVDPHFPDSYHMRDCIEGTSLELIIASRKAGLTLTQKVRGIYYSPEGIDFNEGIDASIKDEVYVGKDIDTNQDVFLSVGKYKIFSRNGENVFKILNDRFTYYLSYYGTVEVRVND